MVVKLNDLRHQDAAGFTQKAPRWTIALKYPAEEAPSILLRLVSLVGPTGWFATPPQPTAAGGFEAAGLLAGNRAGDAPSRAYLCALRQPAVFEPQRRPALIREAGSKLSKAERLGVAVLDEAGSA